MRGGVIELLNFIKQRNRGHPSFASDIAAEHKDYPKLT